MPEHAPQPEAPYKIEVESNAISVESKGMEISVTETPPTVEVVTVSTVKSDTQPEVLEKKKRKARQPKETVQQKPNVEEKKTVKKNQTQPIIAKKPRGRKPAAK